ncbi:MAG: hypothetical protein M5U14_09650 [Acidimicrobiia bacterium]|nr:hypothetical protein [Acidimicrobiia bacterium]
MPVPDTGPGAVEPEATPEVPILPEEIGASARQALGELTRALDEGRGTEARNLAVVLGILIDKLSKLQADAEEAAIRAPRVAQAQGALIAEVFGGVFGDPDLDLTAEQRQLGPSLVRRHLARVRGEKPDPAVEDELSARRAARAVEPEPEPGPEPVERPRAALEQRYERVRADRYGEPAVPAVEVVPVEVVEPDEIVEDAEIVEDEPVPVPERAVVLSPPRRALPRAYSRDVYGRIAGRRPGIDEGVS